MSKKKFQLLLLISICLVLFTIFVTYKITNPTLDIPAPIISEYSVSSSKYLQKQRLLLKNIVDNFNNRELMNRYLINNVAEAFVEGNTILVNYKYNGQNVNYVFILDDDTLNISVDRDQVDVFDDVFRLMIAANQQRLGNFIDLSSFFTKKYKYDNFSSDAVAIFSNVDEVQYIINVNNKIK